MQRRHSVSDLDILDALQDVRTDVWAECLVCHQFDRSFKLFLQKKEESHKVVERLFARCKLDKKIYVTLGIRFVSLKGSRQPNPLHSETTCVVSVAA